MTSLAFLGPTVPGSFTTPPDSSALLRGGAPASSSASASDAAAGPRGVSSLIATSAVAVGSLAVARALRRRSAAQYDSRGSHRCRRVAVSVVNPDAEVLLEVLDVRSESTDEERKPILKGLNLTIREGEVHAIMGPNGSGKSTLSKVLVGDSQYEVMGGTATLGGKNLFELAPHERALEGLFLAFQSPPSVNGVTNLDFLRAAYNAQRRSREEKEFDVIEFYGLVSEKLTQLKVNPEFLNRNVNDGFSGGERKRNEMLQMSVLEPRVAILDEIDSGLDIDALKDVSNTIRDVRGQDPKRALLIVTHFERFLKYVDPDFVHVMSDGKIIKSGGRELADKLDAEGYDWVLKEYQESLVTESK